MSPDQKRIFWIIADSLGVGELPDAASFGDQGSNTLASIVNTTNGLNCSTLQKLGLANILDLPLWSGVEKPLGSWGKMAEASPGKDTSTGHWEMAGVPLDRPFTVYPNGFNDKLIGDFCKQADVPGVLGNKPASGTEIIKELGEEHIATGKPIVYTSADSVFQIAAHESHFGLERLYKTCKIARKIVNDYDICRVIARPFVGDTSDNFIRTPNRHDYSFPPPRPTILDAAKEAGFKVVGVGKIPDIFANCGITDYETSKSNKEGMDKVIDWAKRTDWSGIIMVNLVDFDMLYGHRRNPKGYREALELMDEQLAVLLPQLQPNDLMLISADHGCDPTFKGSDHTREYVPIIFYQKDQVGRDLGTRETFADVAATLSVYLDLSYESIGTNML